MNERRLKRASFIVAALAMIPVALIGYQAVFTSNFHEILPGQFYRSAQMSPGELATRIERFQIRTVLNLRGTGSEPAWYQEERDVTSARDVRLVNFPMSASRRLTPEQALELVEIMKAAPKPLLVHCLGGADRTGLVSMIFLNQVAGIDEETAERQLTPLYGHIGIPFLSSTFAMDQSWEELEPLFGIEGS